MLQLPLFSFLLVRVDEGEADGTTAIRPYTSISDLTTNGYFELIIKRYDEWGVKESPETHFLFTKTNHSYRPPGAVSNYFHRLEVGQEVYFKRTLFSAFNGSTR